MSDEGLKVGCLTFTTLRIIPLPKITPLQKVAFGILCAKSVCRDVRWNTWADRWLSGENRSGSAALAAHAAVLDEGAAHAAVLDEGAALAAHAAALAAAAAHALATAHAAAAAYAVALAAAAAAAYAVALAARRAIAVADAGRLLGPPTPLDLVGIARRAMGVV
ncbi:MAG: hypothetical protein AB7L70_18505 [Pyrinomonadaceae bacterium]